MTPFGLSHLLDGTDMLTCNVGVILRQFRLVVFPHATFPNVLYWYELCITIQSQQ